MIEPPQRLSRAACAVSTQDNSALLRYASWGCVRLPSVATLSIDSRIDVMGQKPAGSSCLLCAVFNSATAGQSVAGIDA